MKISGIYKIQAISKPERFYIGSAVNIHNRWLHHAQDLRKNKHHSKKLQRHYNKYGQSDLQFSVIIGCEKDDLLKNEQYFLDAYRPYFNGCITAGSSLGIKLSEEHKQKISTAHKGKPAWNKGKKYSEATRRRISEVQRGKIPWNKGKKGLVKMSMETRKMMSESRKGMSLSEETRENMSKARRRRDPAVNALNDKNSSIRMKGNQYWLGRNHTEETKLKMSEKRRATVERKREKKLQTNFN
jgi:group I intron endonuclease